MLRSRTRPARPRSRSTTRPARCRVDHMWQCFDVGRAINPTLVEGQIQGGALMGLGLAVLEECYPYYPSAEHRGSEFGSYLSPGIEGLPEIDTIIIENPSADGPYGAKGISEMANNPQPPAIAAAVYDAVGVWVTELPITPERVLRALERKERGPAARRQVGDLRRGHLGEHRRRRGLPLPLPRRCLSAPPFGTWNGVEPQQQFRPASAARDRRRAGARLPCELRARQSRRAHSHPDTEQLIAITAGRLEVTFEGETSTMRRGRLGRHQPRRRARAVAPRGRRSSSRHSRPCRSTTSPTASATSCSGRTAGQRTSRPSLSSASWSRTRPTRPSSAIVAGVPASTLTRTKLPMLPWSRTASRTPEIASR